MATSEELERLQRTDHDTLIRVEAKMDNLALDVKTAAAETASRLNDHESRLRSLETLLQRFPPETHDTLLQGLVVWKRDMATSWKTIAWIFGSIQTLLTLVSVAVAVWQSLN